MPNTALIKIGDIYFKREDTNPTGSAKDRAVAVQLENLLKNNFKSAVISSTGNAAISAGYFCRKQGIPLTVFVSPKIPQSKLKLIDAEKIITTPTPISDAFKFAKSGAYLLRQSTDPSALIGYQQIGAEIVNDLPAATSVFAPVGSGTTLLGISQNVPENIAIFAVQPACHSPVASVFDTDFQPESETITDALSVKLLPLKNQLLGAIKNHHGSGLVVQDTAVRNAQTFLLKNNIDTSAEGALALAGFFKAKTSGLPVGNYPVIILTGTNRNG